MGKAHWPPRVQEHAIPWPRPVHRSPPNSRPFPRARLRRLCEAQNNRCCYCGLEMPWTNGHKHAPTIEHVIPLSKGGPRSWSNEVAACYRCNSGRKITDPLDFLFQCHANMASQQWSKWNSRARKDRRRAVLCAVFARLGVPVDADGRPHPSLRDCWPKPTLAKKLAATTRAELWAKAAGGAIIVVELGSHPQPGGDHETGGVMPASVQAEWTAPAAACVVGGDNSA